MLHIVMICIYLRQTWLFINKKIHMEHPPWCFSHNQHTFMNKFIKWRLVSAPSLVLKGKQTVANAPDPVIAQELHKRPFTFYLPLIFVTQNWKVINIYMYLQELNFISNIILLHLIHSLYLCSSNIFGTSIKDWWQGPLKSMGYLY